MHTGHWKLLVLSPWQAPLHHLVFKLFFKERTWVHYHIRTYQCPPKPTHPGFFFYKSGEAEVSSGARKMMLKIAAVHKETPTKCTLLSPPPRKSAVLLHLGGEWDGGDAFIWNALAAGTWAVRTHHMTTTTSSGSPKKECSGLVRTLVIELRMETTVEEHSLLGERYKWECLF